MGMWNTSEMENNSGCTVLEDYRSPQFLRNLQRNLNKLYKMYVYCQLLLYTWFTQSVESMPTSHHIYKYIGHKRIWTWIWYCLGFYMFFRFPYHSSAEEHTQDIHPLSHPSHQSFAPEWSPSQSRWSLGRTSQTLCHLLLHQKIWFLYTLWVQLHICTGLRSYYLGNSVSVN